MRQSQHGVTFPLVPHPHAMGKPPEQLPCLELSLQTQLLRSLPALPSPGVAAQAQLLQPEYLKQPHKTFPCCPGVGGALAVPLTPALPLQLWHWQGWEGRRGPLSRAMETAKVSALSRPWERAGESAQCGLNPSRLQKHPHIPAPGAATGPSGPAFGPVQLGPGSCRAGHVGASLGWGSSCVSPRWGSVGRWSFPFAFL